jgi:hypothetical protein
MLSHEPLQEPNTHQGSQARLCDDVETRDVPRSTSLTSTATENFLLARYLGRCSGSFGQIMNNDKHHSSRSTAFLENCGKHQSLAIGPTVPIRRNITMVPFLLFASVTSPPFSIDPAITSGHALAAPGPGVNTDSVSSYTQCTPVAAQLPSCHSFGHRCQSFSYFPFASSISFQTLLAQILVS